MSSHLGVSDLKTVNGDRDDGPGPADPEPFTGSGVGRAGGCDSRRPVRTGVGEADGYDIAAGLPQDSSTGREDQTAKEGGGSESTLQIERCVSLDTEVQQKAHTVPGTGAGVSAGACVCEIRNAGSDPAIRQSGGGNPDQALEHCPLSGIAGCNAVRKISDFPVPGHLHGQRSRSVGAGSAGQGRRCTARGRHRRRSARCEQE